MLCTKHRRKENKIEIINFYVNHTFIFKLAMLYKLQINLISFFITKLSNIITLMIHLNCNMINAVVGYLGRMDVPKQTKPIIREIL